MKRGTRYLSTIILFLTLTLLVIPLSLTQEIESLTDERIETISVKEMLTIPDSVKEQTNFENILRIDKPIPIYKTN